MSLLALERVGKRYRQGRRQCIALNDVSLTVEAGELVSVWGTPRSGRTTLLRVAAGIERPDEGIVRFDGRALSRHASGARLGDGIAFAHTSLPATAGHSIVDDVAMPLLARGATPAAARARAELELERVGADGCAHLRAHDLDASEVVRVAIARALVAGPRLLVVDDPIRNVDLLAREAVLDLLRSIAGGDVAVLMTTGEALGVSGVDRALTISEGVLRTEVVANAASVIPLRGDG